MGRVMSKKNGTMIEILPEEKRWFENLVMKETLIKKQAQEAILAIAKEAETMMSSISERVGVDMKTYDIDWDKCSAYPRQTNKEEVKCQKKV